MTPAIASDAVGAAPDVLTVRGIECFAHHGVFDHERRDGQVFLVDLELGIDTSAAAQSDALTDTIDYGSLALAVKHAVECDPVDLIETVAHRVVQVCLDAGVEWARVSIHKPQAPIPAVFSDVVLTIARHSRTRPPTSSKRT